MRTALAWMFVVSAGVAGASIPGRGAPDDAAAFAIPAYRHIDPSQAEPDFRKIRRVRFLVDENFPPFSYKDADGALTGINVAMGDAICRGLRLKCEFVLRKWPGLVAALEAGKGDAILAGLRPGPDNIEKLSFTRPYYRFTARFAVRTENPEKSSDVRVLAGKRIAVAAKSAHEAYLKANFSRSAITPFATPALAREALRTGKTDFLFADSLQLMFWVSSEGSHGCCRMLKGAYLAPRYFSPGLSIAVLRANKPLREVLDYGLDRLQVNGTTDRLFRRFLTHSPW